MTSQDELVALRQATINLNAGPSPLPLGPLLEAANSLVSFPGTPGMGIAEISHRSAAFQKVIDEAEQDLRTLLAIPDNYKVLWMQGGGLTQFAAVVLNLVGAYRIKHKTSPSDEVVGEYVVTGSWSKKAAEEGARMGITAKKIVDGKKATGKFQSIPSVGEWDLSSHSEEGKKPAFVYYCDNETVDGVEFSTEVEGAFPFDKIDKDVPVVCDMSSNFLSRPVDVSKYGILYAGAQKNLGPSGVTVVIVREDLLVELDDAVEFGGARVPSMLSYKTLADSGSMYNTPPTFAIYVCSLVLRSLLASPPYPLSTASAAPLSPLAQLASAKSSAVYTAVDSSSGFYKGTAQPSARSRMNPTFRLASEELEKKFIKLAGERGIKGVNGHRSVGGIRTSIYNAVTLSQVEKLVDFMDEFRKAEST